MTHKTILFAALILLAPALPGAGLWSPSYDLMPMDWGPQRIEQPHPPFRMPVLKQTSQPRLKRLYLRNRISLGAEGLVLGHDACGVQEAKDYLNLSGAGEQARNLHTIQKNQEGWKRGQDIAFMVDLSVQFTRLAVAAVNAGRPAGSRIPSPPDPGLGGMAGRQAAGDVAQISLLQSLRKPAGEFNARLAAALGLKAGGDIRLSAEPMLPPALEDLDFRDLGPDEKWREFEADYRISRRHGMWFVGEGAYSAGEVSSWLSSLGYDKAAARMLRREADTRTMQALAEVNARIPIHIEIRARAANPDLFPKSVGGSLVHSRRDGALSPREMEDQ